MSEEDAMRPDAAYRFLEKTDDGIEGSSRLRREACPHSG